MSEVTQGRPGIPALTLSDVISPLIWVISIVTSYSPTYSHP